MDNFYRIENIEVFRKWVYYQVLSHKELRLEIYDERTYKIFYKNKVARFVVWPIGIIEEAIVDDEELTFYLHYQFQNFKYATDLFNRMIDKLLEEVEIKKRKVLLCCSGGLTTGYFAQRLNHFCKLNQLPYFFEATGVDRIKETYDKYELILLAPQIQYQVKRIKEEIKGCLLASIDPMTFATYDCALLLKLVQSYQQGDHNE